MTKTSFARGRSALSRVMRRALRRPAKVQPFDEAREYWERRYAEGGNSGPGSYKHLADFKAEVLNRFVAEHKVASVIEFGCGDGNQLTLADYPRYTGLDVSPSALRRCIESFADRETFSFFLYDSRSFVDREGWFTAELGLSLDVVYHLVEDEVFEAYLRHLFAASSRFVILYSSDEERRVNEYIRHRKVTDAVAKLAPGWSLIERVPNRFPYTDDYVNQSFAEFFVYEKQV